MVVLVVANPWTARQPVLRWRSAAAWRLKSMARRSLPVRFRRPLARLAAAADRRSQKPKRRPS